MLILWNIKISVLYSNQNLIHLDFKSLNMFLNEINLCSLFLDTLKYQSLCSIFQPKIILLDSRCYFLIWSKTKNSFHPNTHSDYLYIQNREIMKIDNNHKYFVVDDRQCCRDVVCSLLCLYISSPVAFICLLPFFDICFMFFFLFFVVVVYKYLQCKL